MKVKLIYFKDSGEYYTDVYYISTRDLEHGHLVVCQEVTIFQSLGIMPGLSSGVWEGYVLVQPVDSVPTLLDFTKKHENINL
jgi:hypothetical protein